VDVFNATAFKLLPMKDISIDAKIHESISLVTMKLEFIHPQALGEKNAETVDVVYKFPKYKTTVLSKLQVQIDQDRVIETKLVDKPASSFNVFDDKTEDVVPNSKVDEDDRDAKELYRIEVGAVKPGQSVHIEMHLLMPLEIVNGAYQLHIP
jgi:hypothetical protein